MGDVAVSTWGRAVRSAPAVEGAGWGRRVRWRLVAGWVRIGIVAVGVGCG